MAFINKIVEPVLTIKLTSKGREKLSIGSLNYTYYAIGDSEIDYKYISNTGLSGGDFSLLKPVDINPNIVSFLKKNQNITYYSDFPLSSDEIVVTNEQEPIGFFNITNSGTTFNTSNPYIKAFNLTADSSDFNVLVNRLVVDGDISGVVVGDIVIFKSINASDWNISGANIYQESSQYLTYRIVSIEYDNGEFYLDRNLPIFTGITSTTFGVIVLNGNVDTNQVYSNQDNIDAVFNNILSTETDFPYWKLSIIFTDEVIGVKPTNKNYSQFKSAKYAGFVSYIQNQSIIYKKLGVIHYSNTSPLNTYGESLFNSTPTLRIPTIMWHKSLTNKLGADFISDATEKYFTGSGTTGMRYHDLIDESGYVVGKVFNDLKLFVIEDQELLFAMSYKSNRSWSLPNYTVGINEGFQSCATCEMTVVSGETGTARLTQPSSWGGTGKLSFAVDKIYGDGNTVIAEAFGSGNSIMRRLTGTTVIGTANTVAFEMTLPADTYDHIDVIDYGLPTCIKQLTGFTLIAATTTTTSTTLPPTTTTTTTQPPVGVSVHLEIVNDFNKGNISNYSTQNDLPYGSVVNFTVSPLTDYEFVNITNTYPPYNVVSLPFAIFGDTSLTVNYRSTATLAVFSSISPSYIVLEDGNDIYYYQDIYQDPSSNTTGITTTIKLDDTLDKDNTIWYHIQYAGDPEPTPLDYQYIGNGSETYGGYELTLIVPNAVNGTRIWYKINNQYLTTHTQWKTRIGSVSAGTTDTNVTQYINVQRPV